MSEDEFEDEDLEQEDFEEDAGLIALSSDEIIKYLQSFDIYFENPGDKSRRSLVMENTIEFLDNMRKVKNSEYSGFKDLLLSISSKIDTAKQFCTGKDVGLLDLLNDAEDLIQNYLKGYQKPEKYSYPKHEKYSKYPTYDYKKSEYQPIKAPKDIVKSMARELVEYNPRNGRSENWKNLANKLALEYDGKIPKEEEQDPFITKIINESLSILRNRESELEKKKLELQELSKKQIALVDKKQSLSEYRKVMLGKFIDSLIQSEKER
jgi:uncharacterized ubiquitin-like protein YukD